jgi:predicted metalloendopeptidase
MTKAALPTFVLVIAIAACGSAPPSPPAPPAPPAIPSIQAASIPPVAPGHSVDLDGMDRSLRPGADFFRYANGGWYAKAEIPADRAATGIDLVIAEQTEERTKDLLEAAAGSGAAPGSDAQKMGDYYASALDEATLERRGIHVMDDVLGRIARIADRRGLAAWLGSQLRADVDPLNAGPSASDHVLGLWVEQDLNDPTRTAAYLLQGGLGLPDRSNYLDEAPRMVDLRAKYRAHVATMLRLAGVKDADGRATRILAFETKLATIQESREASQDVLKANNPWARADFSSKAKGMDWAAFFRAARLDSQDSFVVWQPPAVVGLATLVSSAPLQAWRDYLTARALDHCAAVLPKAFRDEAFAFYGRELEGIQTPLPRWKEAIELTNGGLGFLVGKAYVERHFPPASKQAIEAMVRNLVAAFAKRIDALDWMAPATRAKAKEKLATLHVGVGYPDAWKSYAGLEVIRGEALENQLRAEQFHYDDERAKLGKPVDRGDWAMLPQIDNACNLPVRNALNFPAGTLVAPYFDPDHTPAANYAAIGAVIGHEISHSFDDQGAQFDAHGRLTDWWTAEDRARFEASGAALARQFDAYRPFPDVGVNGKLTLGEDIADLAGLAAAYDAWRASLGGAAPPMQDGLTGDQQFFLAYAQSWRTKLREQAERLGLSTDPHAPPHYRVWTVRNLDPWYDAFDVRPDDAMFLAPEARVRVW